MTDIHATLRAHIERCEWDELLSALEAAVLLRGDDDDGAGGG